MVGDATEDFDVLSAHPMSGDLEVGGDRNGEPVVP
jgi:hypothetical protein